MSLRVLIFVIHARYLFFFNIRLCEVTMSGTKETKSNENKKDHVQF